MYEIIPGILEKDWKEIERKIELVKPFAKTIHIDIADGVLVPNTTFLDPKPFAKYSKEIFFELHMMVDEPIKFLQPFADAGFKRFMGHIEKMSDQVEFIAKGEQLGEVGLAIDGPTSLDAVKVSYEDLDCMMIYTTEKAGFSGPPFNPSRLEKVKQIREKSSTIPIEVDGGINDKTILLARDTGVTRFITTSFLYWGEDPKKQYSLLQNLLL